MLSNKSIKKLADFLWPEFDERVDWAEVLDYHRLSDTALDIFEKIGLEVVTDNLGVVGVDISEELAHELVNELSVRGVKEAKRIYNYGRVENDAPA